MPKKPTYEELEAKIAELEESKEFFENILDMLPELVSYIDRNHRFRFGNRAYQKFFDVDSASMSGLHPREILGAEAFQGVESRHKAALSGQEQEYESKLVLPNGEPYYFRAHYLPHKKDGQIEGFLAIVQDLTERKQVEEALGESEKEFKDLFDNAPLGYVEYDQGGRIKRVNQTYLDMLGYKREEMLGEYVWDFYAEKEEYKKRIKAKLEGRQPAGREFTRSCRRKDGSVLPALVEDRLLMDSEKRILGIRCSYQDITERKKAEKALSEKVSELGERNEFIQTILDNLPIGLAINYFDKGTATYMNKRFEEIYGWPEEELKNVQEFFEKVYPDPDYRQEIQPQVLADINSGDPERMQWDNLEVTHKDGSKRIISAKNIPIFEQNFMISTVQDVTARVIAEKELKEALLWQKEVVKAGNVGLWDWDLLANKVTYSREWKQQIGYEEDEISNDLHEWQSRVHPDDLQSTLKAVNRSIAELNQDHYTEFRFRHKDGSYRWIASQASILTEDEGRPIRMLGSHFDITERKQAEEALRKSEELLSEMARQIPGVLYQAYARQNGERGLYYVSERSETILGLKPHLDGFFERFAEMVIPEHREDFIQSIEKSVNEISPWHYEGMLQKPTGERIWFSGHSFPSVRENEVVFNGIVQDISERKQAEKELRKKDAMLANIASQVPGMLYQFLMKPDGTYSVPYSSKGVMDIFGCSPEDIQDDFEPIFNAIHPEDRNEILRTINESKENLSQWKCEYRVQVPGKPIKWVFGNSIPEKMEDGSILWSGYNVDITERKQAEEALRSSEEKFSRLFFSSPTWLAFTRLEDGEYLEINDAFEKITGFSRAETIGRTSLELGLWDDTKERERLMKIAREEGGFKEQEVVFRTKDDNPLPALWSAVAVQMDGEERLLSTVMDISELKRAEQEKESLLKELQQAHKMEAIGNLAGGIAHEFNNVLGIIVGNAELALDDVPDWNPTKEYLKEIRIASFRAKEVVRQILSFARKTMKELKPIEINTIAKESLKLMRASIPAMVDIQANIPSDPKTILGDPTEIHQIIINLCTNAAHAMKASGGTLEVGITEVALDERTASRYEDLATGDFIRLTVKDSGEGISPDILDEVFEPYFTTKEFGAGSGMGLAVVYGLVKKCNGAIKITSTVGEGTNVEILFPKIHEKAPAKEKKDGELPKGNERILLVDDDPSIVTILSQMLKRLGYAVTAMTDSTAALEQFKSRPNDFDLVITDMAMPKMSGDQLAAELIRVRKDIPILLCTGHSDTVDEKKAKKIGIKGFAMKPLAMGKLARSVRAVLDERS